MPPARSRGPLSLRNGARSAVSLCGRDSAVPAFATLAAERKERSDGDREQAKRRARVGCVEGREEVREAEGEGRRARERGARRAEQVGARHARSDGRRRPLLLAQEVGRHHSRVTEDGFLRPSLSALVPYEPGKPVEEVQRELGLARVVKLASNEGPYGPFPAALEAMGRAAGELNRYPDGGAYRLRAALAERHGVRFEEIALA